MNLTNKLKNNRPNIAVLVGSLSSFYQDEILRGAAFAGREEDFNIIGFCGGPFKSLDPLSQIRASLFDLVDTNLFNGIIIPVSSHTRYLNNEEIQTFLHKFDNIPLINIGGKLPGYTSIIPDYTPGLTDTIEHFVNHHGYKHIAFFRGPSQHATSNEREAIFRKTMSRLNQPINENLIIYSDLRKTSAFKAVSELLDVRSQTCDAIICVNDSLALGVIDCLNERHIRIPEDIALSGSLGNVAGIFSNPPLTTIKEPIFELGVTAIHTISKYIKEGYSPENIFIPTEMIKRKSCGCKSNTLLKPMHFESIKNSHVKTHEEKLEALYQITCNELYSLLNTHRCPACRQNLDILLSSFHTCLHNENFVDFFHALRFQLENSLKTLDIMPWIRIAELFEYSGIQFLNLLQNKEIVEDYLETISLIIEDITQKALIFQNSETDFYINFSREIVNNLNSTFDFNAVRSYAVELLDLTELYVSIYDNNSTNFLIANSIIAIRDKKLVDIPINERRYEAQLLIPQSVDMYKERYDLVIFPLAYHKNPLGYLILNLSDRKGSAYENMQSIISTSLKNELQIRELTEAEARFSDIAHSTSDWLWETDVNHIFTYSSHSVMDTIGFSIDEILGCSIHSNAYEEWLSFYHNMMDHNLLSNIETWFHHKNGHSVCLLISSIPIFKNNHFAGYRGVFKDVTEKKIQENKIKTLAYYDTLTNLPNRALFHEKLNTLVETSIEANSRFGLMFLDLDRFKYVNDSMGHDSGDQLLKIIGKRLKETIRSNDFLARLNGDEFTILLTNLEQDYDAVLLANKILEAIIAPIKIHDKELIITVSIGISIFPTDGITPSDILKSADTAMYKAKSKGKNCYGFYDKEIDDKNTNRLQIEEILYRALKENYFTVYYQPKVNTLTKELTGFEALVRIKDPIKGLISPGMFIDIAEELGLIDKIDEIVVRIVCQQITHWQSQGLKILPISVNLSPSQLKHREVFDTYMNIVKKIGISPNLLELEITENALISNESLALEILTEFKTAGFSIALDDFGTGYSSLSSIGLYPLNTIKIDRSFIQNMEEVKSTKAIMKAIIQMANDLNIKVIAEGVETEFQYNIIKSLGCTEIQGYYFSKPLDPLDIKLMESTGHV